MLIMLHGLPFSGKDTFAKRELPKALCISKNALIEETVGKDYFFNSYSSPVIERRLAAMFDMLVKGALSSGEDVICANDNLSAAEITSVVRWAVECEVPVLDFTMDTPLQTVLDRNEISRRSGGRFYDPDYLRSLAELYGRPEEGYRLKEYSTEIRSERWGRDTTRPAVNVSNMIDIYLDGCLMADDTRLSRFYSIHNGFGYNGESNNIERYNGGWGFEATYSARR